MTKSGFVKQFRGHIRREAERHLFRLQARHADAAVLLDVEAYLRLLDIKTAHLIKVASELGLGEQTIQTILIDHRDTGDVDPPAKFEIYRARSSINKHPAILARDNTTAPRAP